MFATEIFDLYLNADVLVLNNIAPDPNAPVEFLTAPLHTSGVSNVLAQKGGDHNPEGERLFLSSFYDSLSNGETPREAERTAKLKLVKNKNFANPKIWSTWVLSGKH